MQHRTLGGGLRVSALGLGCVSMSDFYGERDLDESLATLRRARELGVTFFDTSDAYGVDGHNELLLGRAFATERDEVVIATKFGLVKGDGPTRVDASPSNVRRSCDASLRRLGTDRIDLYYAHRVDPSVPVEDTVGAMAELVAAGKVRAIGLCEASADTLRRASTEHCITALQSEWSLSCRQLESEVLPTARELGIGIVPFSPLGRGLLTASVDREQLTPGDFRSTNPRFAPENYERNRLIVEAFRRFAEDLGATPAQLAVAWLLHQGDDVVPIPGTARRAHLEDNAGASHIELTEAHVRELDELIGNVPWAGARYRAENRPPFDGSYGSTPPRPSGSSAAR